MRKFYNGLGQLIQAQRAGAVLADNACSSDPDTTPNSCDVLVGPFYNTAGQAWKQSMPYAVTPGSGYRTPDAGKPFTQTGYDLLGRTQSVDSLAGETMNYSYDALNRLTGVAGALSESYSYDPGSGNLASKAGASYSYAAQVSCPGGVRTIAHAVSSAGGNSYGYDCNGSMTSRVESGQGYSLSYDAESRLVGVASLDQFADGFESGEFSGWSSSVTHGGDLAVTGAAALSGAWGMQALIDDNTAIYVTDQSPQDESAYAASFRYDPNSIGMALNNLFTLLAGYLDIGSLAYEVQQYYDLWKQI